MDLVTIILIVGFLLLFVSDGFAWAALKRQEAKHAYDLQNLRYTVRESQERYYEVRRRLEALETELCLEYQETHIARYVHKE